MYGKSFALRLTVSAEQIINNLIYKYENDKKEK